jgi:hypothetical protein
MTTKFVGHQVKIRPDPNFGNDSTFFAFNSGNIRFEVSGLELLDKLEQDCAELEERYPEVKQRLNLIRDAPSDALTPGKMNFGSDAQWTAALAKRLWEAITSKCRGLEMNKTPGFFIPGERHWMPGYCIPAMRHCFTLFEQGRFRIVGPPESDSELVMQNWEERNNFGLGHGAEMIFWSRSGNVVLSRGTWVS